MKQFNFKEKYKNYVFIILVIFLTSMLMAEDDVEKDVLKRHSYLAPELSLETIMSYPGSIGLTSELESAFYNLLIGFSIPNLHKVEKLSELKFNLSGAGLRFSPIGYTSGKDDFQPMLSFFVGQIYESKNFKKLYSCCFYNVSHSYSGISFPSEGNFNISKKGVLPDFGFEIFVNGFGFNLLASRSKKTIYSDYGVFASWSSCKKGLHRFGKNSNEAPKISHNLFISGFAGFSASAKKIYIKQSRQKFNSVYGASIIYANDFIELETTALGSITSNKKIGWTASSQIDGFYKWFGLKTGISYASKHFIGFKNTYSKTDFCVFVNPQFKTDHFSFRASYSFFVLPPKKTEDYTKGLPKNIHSTSAEIKLNYDYVDFITSLKYKEDFFSPSVSLKLMHPDVSWFDFFSTSFYCTTQKKQINPYIIAKYKFALSMKFMLTEYIGLQLSSALSQKNRFKCIKQNGQLLHVIQWDKYKINADCKLDFSQGNSAGNHKFSIGLNIYNVKPFYKVSLSYKLNTK